MTSSSSDEILSLRLLVDTKSNKVLFAEADSFLFGILNLPVGVVSKFCCATAMHHGSIVRIYDSVNNIGASYLQPDIDKSDLLDPDMTALGTAYVKAPEKYIVTDGLEVTPMSAISTLALANRFILNKDVEPAEKVVSIDSTDEILPLVAAAMCSDTVLSDVFLGSNK